MISSDFETTTHGKWILAGEHAVLRGHEALVFPILEKTLHLKFLPAPSELRAEFIGENGSDLSAPFWEVFKQGMQMLNQPMSQLTGHFKIKNDIPIGAGMGASAALSVALTRWFISQQCMPPKNTLEFAQKLENIFHGKSSGLDIAGASSIKGLSFQNGNTAPLNQAWKPTWYLSKSNQIGITAKCIEQVQMLWESAPETAAIIDKQMQEAVTLARLALSHKGKSALGELADAIKQAANCFKAWGLETQALSEHMKQLMHAGALAVKPTGSGGGGYVLSLWNHPPAKKIKVNFIKI